MACQWPAMISRHLITPRQSRPRWPLFGSRRTKGGTVFHLSLWSIIVCDSPLHLPPLPLFPLLPRQACVPYLFSALFILNFYSPISFSCSFYCSFSCSFPCSRESVHIVALRTNQIHLTYPQSCLPLPRTSHGTRIPRASQAEVSFRRLKMHQTERKSETSPWAIPCL